MSEPLPSPTPLAGFTGDQMRALAALVDVIVPEDEDPGGWDGGVARLLHEHSQGFLSWAVAPLKAAVAAAEDEAMTVAGVGYAELGPRERRAVVDRLVEREGATDRPAPGMPSTIDRDSATPVAALARVAFEGYYGNTSEPAGWTVANFTPVPDDVTPVDPDPPAGVGPGSLARHYDAVVVGPGPEGVSSPPSWRRTVGASSSSNGRAGIGTASYGAIICRASANRTTTPRPAPGRAVPACWNWRTAPSR
ncbi:gluconate 2-dehydrogenase subunit 3 family protein [Pseudonocardia sp. ICBG1293]|uniref:gluconate 2-dehydrogenase subunit 3 family protein n=1 Tax=Pseudonocardia sp. ICBG1293 TaxID=2844382 RepID=UPI0035A85CF1